MHPHTKELFGHGWRNWKKRLRHPILGHFSNDCKKRYLKRGKCFPNSRIIHLTGIWTYFCKFVDVFVFSIDILIAIFFAKTSVCSRPVNKKNQCIYLPLYHFVHLVFLNSIWRGQKKERTDKVWREKQALIKANKKKKKSQTNKELSKNLIKNTNKASFFPSDKEKTLVVFKRKLTAKPCFVFQLHTYYSFLVTR